MRAQASFAKACGIGLFDFLATDMWLVFASMRLAFIVELESAFKCRLAAIIGRRPIADCRSPLSGPSSKISAEAGRELVLDLLRKLVTELGRGSL